MNKKNIKLLLILVIVVVIGVGVFKVANQKQEVVNIPLPQDTEPTIEDVLIRLQKSQATKINLTNWIEYPEVIGEMKFYYPNNFFPFIFPESNNSNNVVVSLFLDIPEYRIYAQDQTQGEYPSVAININTKPFNDKFIPEKYIKENLQPDVLKWKETTFMGYPALAYTGQSAEYFDGLVFVRNNVMYEFRTSFWASIPEKSEIAEPARNAYYKILSTLEFLK